MVSITEIIVERVKELKAFKKCGKFVLIYGRRKTGKTFFVKHWVNYDRYYFVSRDRSIFAEEKGGKFERISYETFAREFMEMLKQGKVVVVDEFQRLQEDFLDMVHVAPKTGSLILLASALGISYKILSSASPILGLFCELVFSLIDEIDILKSLSRYYDLPDLAIAATYAREPWVIPFLEKNVHSFLKFLLIQTKHTIPALIGEIFTEEDRTMSSIYAGVLKAVSDGKLITSEIADYLFSNKLISKNDPSLVAPYLKNLLSIGILEKMEDFKVRRCYYQHVSPVVDAYYFLDAKYGFSERDLPEKELEISLKNLIGRHFEQFSGKLLSKIYGLEVRKWQAKEFEIDFVLTSFKKPKIAVEVKLSLPRKKEMEQISQKLDLAGAKQKILFVPDAKGVEAGPSGLKVLDFEQILKAV